MKHFELLISVSVLLSLLAIQVYAVEIVFDAFSGEKPIPDEKVQDPEEWAKNSVTPNANTFSVANDRLVQTANECAMSTKTLLPVVDGSNWVNYTVSVDVWYNDDDAVGIIFRYTDEGSFYSFVIAGADENYNNQWYVGDASAGEAVC